jgi:hypothetical protein
MRSDCSLASAAQRRAALTVLRVAVTPAQLEMEATTRKKPTIVQSHNHRNGFLGKKAKKRGKMDIIAVQISQMYNIGTKLFQKPHRLFCGKARVKALCAEQSGQKRMHLCTHGCSNAMKIFILRLHTTCRPKHVGVVSLAQKTSMQFHRGLSRASLSVHGIDLHNSHLYFLLLFC